MNIDLLKNLLFLLAVTIFVFMFIYQAENNIIVKKQNFMMKCGELYPNYYCDHLWRNGERDIETIFKGAHRGTKLQ